MNSADGNRCWHCGEPLPAGVVIHATVADQSRAMCCHGCRAAAEWIGQLGLVDYYRLRTQPAQTPSDVSADASADPWHRAENARHVIRDLGAGKREVVLLVEGIRCSACVWLIERMLGCVPGVVSVQVNAVARRARVVWREAEATLPQLLQALLRTGYRALPLDSRGLDDARRSESRDALKRLLVAGFGAMQAMMYAIALYLGDIDSLDSSTLGLLRWLGLLVATPVVFYSARSFFAGAVRSLKAGTLGMDVPIAFAIAAVYAASLFEALRGGGEVYFDSVSMFVFFLLAGRYLEMRARHRASDLTDALARRTPPFADRRMPDGRIERIGIHELEAGDCVQVSEGGIVPADGVLLSEGCRVDEALLSGESTPVGKRKGDSMIGGSIVVDGPVALRIERVGADTVLAGIAALVERAQAERPRLAHAGESAASRFVARVLVLTLATIVGWCLIDPSRAFPAAIAVLVVSCPCAFALAVPVAISRALAVLARRGVLVVKPDAIEALAAVTHVVFDKTGTLTESTLTLAGVETFNELPKHEALRLAATIASHSRHPVARMLAAVTDQYCDEVTAVTAHAGLGLSACMNGRSIRLGRAEFAATQPLPTQFDSAVVLADDTGMIAVFHLQERLRPDAIAAVRDLRAQNLQIRIASGDAAVRVADIAAHVGVDKWRARLLPAEKLAWLSDLRAGGACVLAIGDGVNDAPVLAGADVSIAMGDAAEIAQMSSDIVLAGGRLDAIAPARAIAAQTLTVVQQNQRWALIYNLIAVPFAALGFVPAWLAAIGMSLSSLGVVLNALRIGREPALPAQPVHVPHELPGSEVTA